MSAGEKAFWVRVGWSFMKRGRCFNQWATVLSSFPGTGVFLSHAKQHHLVLLNHQMCRWETALG